MESKMTVDFTGTFTIVGDADSLDSIMEKVVEYISESIGGDGYDIDLNDFDFECVDSR